VPLPVVAPMSEPVPVVEPVLPVPAVVSVWGLVLLLVPAVLEVSAGDVVDGVVDELVDVSVFDLSPQAESVSAAIRASAAALAIGLVFMGCSLRSS